MWHADWESIFQVLVFVTSFRPCADCLLVQANGNPHTTVQTHNTAFERVGELVADFQKDEQTYLAADYKEEWVRTRFIDKFWIALGWDVNNDQRKHPYEQEVKTEENIKIDGRIKKADYAFLAPNFRDVRFFVEAKKPARNIDNVKDYFQTIRYGWNAQTSVSILTDFEQFRLLDCRYKPDTRTALSRALKNSITRITLTAKSLARFIPSFRAKR